MAVPTISITGVPSNYNMGNQLATDLLADTNVQVTDSDPNDMLTLSIQPADRSGNSGYFYSTVSSYMQPPGLVFVGTAAQINAAISASNAVFRFSPGQGLVDQPVTSTIDAPAGRWSARPV